jgi:predicted DNA-binding protein (UPF0278 family)
MVDLTTPLGREVATPQQVLEVIRPEIRIMRAHYQGVIAACRAGLIESSPDLELTDGGDEHADAAVFEALRESAGQSVKDWSRDMGLVFDNEKAREFIRQALIDAMVTEGGYDPLPEGALDY